MSVLLHGIGLHLDRDGRTVLSNAGLSLRAGEVLGLIGPNGAGKSTLLRVLAGLEQAQAGAVTLLDRPLSTWSPVERAARLGFIPQHFQPHWDLRIEALVQLGLDRAGVARPAGPLLTRHGLDGLRARRWSTLSGGERARALAATVLAVDPPVLLADEPAAALDVGQALDLMRRLRERQGATAVVLHNLQLAASCCDSLVLMDRGRVVAAGSAEAVLSNPLLDQVYGVAFERLRDRLGHLLLGHGDFPSK